MTDEVKKAKRPKVDQETCIGCGLCVSIAPETFFINDNGKSQVKQNSTDSEKIISEAIDGCPVSAIGWEDESDTEGKSNE